MKILFGLSIIIKGKLNCIYNYQLMANLIACIVLNNK